MPSLKMIIQAATGVFACGTMTDCRAMAGVLAGGRQARKAKAAQQKLADTFSGMSVCLEVRGYAVK